MKHLKKILKRIDAGPLHKAVLYDKMYARDNEITRREKKKASSNAQAIFNHKNSFRKLEYMLAANFPTSGSALFGALTFDDAHLPYNRKEAQLRFKYFLRKLRAERESAGLQAPVVFWAPEVLTSKSGRWHIHMIIDNTGEDYDIIRNSWIYGTDIDLEKSRFESREDYEKLARYMTKESRECQDYASKPGLHGWSYTRNAKKLETDSLVVPDDFVFQLPDGAFDVDKFDSSNSYASLLAYEYLDQSLLSPSSPAARRKKTACLK